MQSPLSPRAERARFPAVMRSAAALLGSALALSAARASASEVPPRAAANAPAFAGEVLERSAFVRAVLARNPTLEAARQGVVAARARLEQAGAFADPMLELGIAPLSIASRAAPFGLEAALSQKVPWFGKRALERGASAAEAEGARLDSEALRRELAFAAVALYEQYFVATRALEINAAHLQLMGALREAALAQLSAGRASAADALQADAELAHLEHEALLLSTQREVIAAQMNELLHRAPELPLPPPPAEQAPAEPAGPPRADPAASRPDIAAAEQRARAQQARVQRAERERYPDFTLSASYSSMWDLPAHRWMVGVSLDLPLQLGARAGAAEEARALGAQIEQEAARLRDAARTQVFVARKQLAESGHVLHLYETRLLPLARQRIEAVRAGFASSQNAFAVVIEAQRALRALELEYQKARAEQVTRHAELARALGQIPGLDLEAGKP
ncbi:MAG TPA: TolC family protein [Polyangiaceae bacterium]|nr:TolC family protein [Polyangiaceae bacterium]